MITYRDLSGKRFGRLVCISPVKKKVWWWICQCDCGAKKEVCAGALTRKLKPTLSCGCLAREVMKTKVGENGTNYRHGHAVGSARSETLAIWSNMIRRCHKETDRAYKDYGARGIKVCERWHDFKNFLSDMGERPKGLSMDRIDNDGNYDPSNCRWATQKEQVRNTRRARLVEYNGEVVSMAKLCEEMNLNYHKIYDMVVRKKMSFDQALNDYRQNIRKKQGLA